MQEIKSYSDFIDRLLDNEFNFRVEDNKIIIVSPTNREDSSSILGFHYWGTWAEYYYVLDGFELSDVIYEAFNKYKDYVRNTFKQRIEEMVEVL